MWKEHKHFSHMAENKPSRAATQWGPGAQASTSMIYQVQTFWGKRMSSKEEQRSNGAINTPAITLECCRVVKTTTLSIKKTHSAKAKNCLLSSLFNSLPACCSIVGAYQETEQWHRLTPLERARCEPLCSGALWDTVSALSHSNLKQVLLLPIVQMWKLKHRLTHRPPLKLPSKARPRALLHAFK